MNALIVYAHPEPGSFNAALRDVARETLEHAGHTVEISDLYAEGFDPAEGPAHFPERADPRFFAALTEQRHGFETGRLPADVAREIGRLERAELVIFQFPLWWHAQPAILKGWLDRVLVYGGLYSGSRRYDRGHFRGRRALCAVTTGSPAPAFSRTGRSGAIELLMWPMHCSLYYVGFDVLPPFVAYGIQGAGPAYQDEDAYRALLEVYKCRWARRLESVDAMQPIPFAGWSDWDESGVLRPESPGMWRP